MIDYYAILNIKPTASKKEIKEAFKTEALKWHPDRNSSPDATARMQLINEAYLILKDDEARERYDNQYYKFQETNQERHNNSQEENQWHNYSSNDDILNDWIKKAKKQAKEMVMMSIEDLVGMSKAATSAAWDRTKFLILIVVVGNIILLAIYS
jgi:curved DNA-binding protein CbpA